MMRIAKTALVAAILGTPLLGAAATSGATARPGGVINVFVTPNGSGLSGKVLITGVIGDYGTTLKVSSAGKSDKKGTDAELVLKKGTILVNLTQLKTALQHPPPTKVNTANCSATIIVGAPVSIVRGTKAYTGIAGTLSFSETEAFILPLTKRGRCNTNATKPIAESVSVSGSGMVRFPVGAQ
jgi:hypothetical protein